ncbi:hypothetical protein ES703_34746 [subsurface metagenome]
MDANQAAMDIGVLLEETLPENVPCARLVVDDGVILLVGHFAYKDSDIFIAHLSEKDLRHGLSSPKWNAIEDRIQWLISKGLL